jgi:hypothetical protein
MAHVLLDLIAQPLIGQQHFVRDCRMAA